MLLLKYEFVYEFLIEKGILYYIKMFNGFQFIFNLFYVNYE